MLTDREVLSTLNMLRNEHLDMRTVTLGISLFDCAAHDFDVFAYKVRAKISRYAGRLVETCNDVADKYGIPVVNKRISVSPIGVVGASFSREEMVRACRVLDEAAKNAGVDFLGGFGALVEKGMTPGERNLIDSLPEALACTDRICSSINVASSRSGINMDAVALMGQRILDVAEAHSRRGRFGRGNFSERGAFLHRRARFHRRAGHAQRCGEEGRSLRLLPCGGAFRRVHSRFGGFQHRGGHPVRRAQPREARGHDQRLFRGPGHDRHPRRYARRDHFRHDCG